VNVSNQKYRNIIKASGLIGFLQVGQMFFSVIKSKVTAVYIGAVGLGALGVFTSTMNIFYSLASLGLMYSTTIKIAKYNTNNSEKYVNKIFTLSQYIIFTSSLLITILVIIFSKDLSVYFFNNDNHSFDFILLSFTIIFFSFDKINYASLQGLHKINQLVLSTLFGGFISVISSISLYYFFHERGIVPSIIIGVIVNFFIGIHYIRKNGIKYTKTRIKDFYLFGVPMINLGLVMLVGSLFGFIVTSSVNIFIIKYGSISDVGLYNAGISITTQYVTLIFTSISLDFFPRLSAISSDNKDVEIMVNDQVLISLIVLFPILLGMALSSKFLIEILLTKEFFQLNKFVKITSIFLNFQSLAFVISNIPLAKADKKIFFIWNSIFPGVCALFFFTLGYKFFGLNGLAIGSGIVNVLHFVSMAIVCKIRYNYKINSEVYKLLFLSTLCIILTFLGFEFGNTFISYLIGCLFFIFSLIYSFIKLNKLMGFNFLFSNLIKKS
jgi:O-antigen/teichoic acid export membrane protein